jgi:hypothetical protein
MEKILDKAIVNYSKAKKIAFYPVINRLCSLKKHNWDYYKVTKNSKFDGIRDRFLVLKEMQESRIINGGMDGTYNPTMSIFLLKCKYKYLEEKDRRRLEIDECKSNFDSLPSVIEIGYDESM